ncbi:DUF2652 domain-containing protein [Pedobacter cryophilus]|uniref:DUF2652 domain-containing protein n=1 Tax=Pedobacter cryophilus TaxID=2571271 RepID=A0A4U1C0M3_9SPHI|nr:DUF2652 domain-containing protein [Pedobacter cryophilus]TKB98751.1 DUF2652 domain-containing protein [Pedobacter cryophilus]
MKNKSLVPVFFCIPDLTGFTKFITSTETVFANQVITDLLNQIVSSNMLDMKVAEVEGDAVFFYRTGRLPAVGKVAKQCKNIYDTFKEKIDSYQTSHPEEYQQFLADEQLGIKIVIHFGHISLVKIEGRTKLMGEDVILVHKLLKNGIPEPNYILLTDNYTLKLKDKKTVKNWFNWESVKKGSEQYEHFGLTHYSYISLVDCKNFKKKKSQLPKSLPRIISNPS